MEDKNCSSCKYYENIDGAYICKNDKSERHEERTSSFETCDEFSRANAHTMDDLHYYQSMPLDIKISMTRRRIRDWIGEFGEDGVYVSFSGGKDSTVLLDIVRKDYPNVQAVFVNTGLEYPSVRKFAESKENVVTLRPKMNFREVVSKYGYPIISKEVSQTIYEVVHSVKRGNLFSKRMKKLNGEYKQPNGERSPYNYPQYKFLIYAPFRISHKCCDCMKKNPSKQYEKEKEKKAIIATMAEESFLRTQKWLGNGCNAFNTKRPQSNPMSFWTEQDVLTYIHTTLPLQTHTVKWLLKEQRAVRPV